MRARASRRVGKIVCRVLAGLARQAAILPTRNAPNVTPSAVRSRCVRRVGKGAIACVMAPSAFRAFAHPTLFGLRPRLRHERAPVAEAGAVAAQRRGSGLRPPRASRQRRPPLFSRPGFGAGEGCCYAGHATFELQCRLDPGPGHFQQDLAVPVRFGLAGPAQTLLRELTAVFGRCRHDALRVKNRRERDRSLSHRRLRASCR